MRIFLFFWICLATRAVGSRSSSKDHLQENYQSRKAGRQRAQLRHGRPNTRHFAAYLSTLFPASASSFLLPRVASHERSALAPVLHKAVFRGSQPASYRGRNRLVHLSALSDEITPAQGFLGLALVYLLWQQFQSITLFPQRGMTMPGWRGQNVQIPSAISNSRVSEALRNAKWPSAWPYDESDFKRIDESSDGQFYQQPRFVTHIDDGAIEAIRSFYANQFDQAPQGEFSVLDICSSWISHYPKDIRASRVAITGMVEEELKANGQATEYKTKDLNIDPSLPFGDNECDFVTNVVSVDYLTRPREVFSEMHRVLKPGGVAIMSFSNRCFFTKAIAMWVESMNDGPGHCQIVGTYFYFNPEGGWRDVSSADISPNPGISDPVWVVTAVKA